MPFPGQPGTAPGPRGGARELSNLQFALFLALPVIVFLVLVVIYPLLYAVWLSVHKIEFFGGYHATYVGLQNFVDIARSAEFWQSTLISIRFTIESVALTLCIGLGIALVIARPFRGRSFVRALVILPWSVSLYGTGVIFFYLTSSQGGVVSAVAGLFGAQQPVSIVNGATVIEILALGNAWNLAPLVGFFLAANMATTPERLYQLAAVDRLGVLATFFHVTLPPLRFTFFVFACIVTVMSLKLFDYVYLMTGGGPGRASAVLPYELYKISFQNLKLGLGAAMSFYLLALILLSTGLLYFVWGRRLNRST